MTSLKFLFLIVSLTCLNGIAKATIIYTSEASSTFTLVSSGGLDVSYVLGMEPTSTDSAGSGIATIIEDTQVIVGPTLTQISKISGSVGPGSGFSESIILNDALVVLENTSLLAATAEFSFTYTWFVEILQTDSVEALFESAFANAFFHLSGFAPSGGETLAIDEGFGVMAVPDWEINEMVSFDFTDTGASILASGSTTVKAFITVPGMSTDSFDVITDASGIAVRVYEPSHLLLFALSLLMFRVNRKT